MPLLVSASPATLLLPTSSPGAGRRNICLSVVGRVIIYSFNLNTSPKISYGVLEGDIVILQNYVLMIF